MVDIACDVQQIDETGYVWAFRDEAKDPTMIVPGEIVVAGAEDEPVYALVVDIVGDEPDQIVHLDILPGDPSQYRTAAERAGLGRRS
ncbi:MAG: hypothetical protein BGO26_12405 [Actinobacteria bacterium 69-20]|nr:hypothetical protein [Actinomycetota bacterium]OJV23504.1 MAG: hypothetical protein BGO26_12405 [Actinobacteria bacterium 69-20]